MTALLFMIDKYKYCEEYEIAVLSSSNMCVLDGGMSAALSSADRVGLCNEGHLSRQDCEITDMSATDILIHNVTIIGSRLL